MTVDAEKVFSKHYEFTGKPPKDLFLRLTDGIAAAKGQYDSLNRESYGKEVNGTGKRLFEVDHFCSRSVGEVRGVLQIYR